MSQVRCPYCPGTQGRSAVTAAGRWVIECVSCGRVVEEREVHTHQLFLLRAHDNPLPVVTPDLLPLSPPPSAAGAAAAAAAGDEDEDPFHPTGFITAFSTWSLEPSPLFARSTTSFSGHLAELERALLDPLSAPATPSAAIDPSGPLVSVENLRAYLQILDVSSILRLDHDISDHAFQLFRDCSSATCLRNRNVEALATAALVQAIREAQEPRTLQEISAASNLPQKDIGKYIKILGEALQLSQPINSNSIAVHMPRFCTLLQLNKSAQELAAHIGEVVVNKCFCTRRNPISISAAAIYLACQLEDKRKTQAEICKVTGLTEVTLRKVYKELLENWDDLLPPNYTPAVPPEKAFPMTAIASGRSATPKVDMAEISDSNVQQDKDQTPEIKNTSRDVDVMDTDQGGTRDDSLNRSNSHFTMDLNQEASWQPQSPSVVTLSNSSREREVQSDRGVNTDETKSASSNLVQRDPKNSTAAPWTGRVPNFSSLWPLNVSSTAAGSSYIRSEKQWNRSDLNLASGQGVGNRRGADASLHDNDSK